MSYDCLSYIGMVGIAYFGLKILTNLLKTLHYFCWPPINLKEKSSWALVTGATDGIGKAFAHNLASKGLNVILVSRTLEKLEKVASEIELRYSVRTKVEVIDFTVEGSLYQSKIKQLSEETPVDILINNVGMGYDYPEEYHRLNQESVAKLIHCNITSMNSMIGAILPGMVDRRNGVIINIGSVGGLIPTPLLSVYAGTKAYVYNFTKSLNIEYRNQGIMIQCIFPGYVVSNMSKLKNSNLMQPTPDTFVRSALSKVGVLSATTGYWPHYLILFFNSWVPEWITSRISYIYLTKLKEKALMEN